MKIETHQTILISLFLLVISVINNSCTKPRSVLCTTFKELEDNYSYDILAWESIESTDIKTLPYDIPMRSLIAKDVDGLMMAGRCISGDFFAHASYRVTGNAVAMGEAAGYVAAKAAINDCLPQKIKYEANL